MLPYLYLKKKTILAIIVISFLIFVSYIPVLQNNKKVIAGSDITRYFYFYRLYFHNYYIENNKIPQWEPNTFSGRPFYAMIQNAVLYPATYFCVLFGTETGINLNILFNIWLSAVFAFLFVYKITGSNCSGIIAAFIYGFGGFSTTRVFLGHLTIINTLPYLPASFLFLLLLSESFKFRWALLLGISLALQFFGGQPQFLFYTLFCLLLYFVFLLKRNKRKKSFLILFFWGIIIFISAVIPYYAKVNEYLKLTVRAESMGGYDFYTYWSFEPLKILTTVMPFFFGSSITEDYWRDLWRKLIGFEEYNAFIGVIALLLIVYGCISEKNRMKNFFCCLMFLSLIISFGKYTPIYKFFHYYVPGFKMFRWPIRFMVIFQFSAAVIAGIGLKAFMNNLAGNSLRLKIFRFSVVSAAIIILLLSMLLMVLRKNIYSIALNKMNSVIDAKGGVKYHSSEFYEEALNKIQKSVYKSIGRLSVLMLAAGIIFLVASSKNRMAIPPAICGLLIFELITFHTFFLRTTDNSQCVISAVEHNRLIDKNYRICSNTEKYPPGMNMLFNTASIQGYEPFILKKYDKYARLIEKSAYIPENLLFINPDVNSRLFDLLSAGYLITEKDYNDNPKFKFLKKFGTVSVYKNLNAAPLAYISNKIELTDDTGLLNLIGKRDYDYNLCVYTSEYFKGIESFKISSDVCDSTLVINNKNERERGRPFIINQIITDDYARFNISSDKIAVFVFNYINFPGWSVKVNSFERELLNINYLFMGVIIKPGDSIVEFRFNSNNALTFK